MDRAARRRRLQDRSAPTGLHRSHRDPVHAGRRALSIERGVDALPVWLDGRLLAPDEAPRAEAVLTRPGCITTTRVWDGSPAFFDRHLERLRRDATALGLPAPERESVLRAFRELAHAAFGTGEGIVRLMVGWDDAGRHALVGSARPLGPACDAWRAVIAPYSHPGPGDHPGAKLSARPIWTRARALRDTRQVDETLLFDEAGQLVEGARSNLVVLGEDGSIRYPALELGAVAGVALAVLCDRVSELEPGRIDRAGLDAAREVVAVNAVRGARAIVEIDGEPVGDGRPGEWARRLDAEFEAALQEASRSLR